MIDNRLTQTTETRRQPQKIPVRSEFQHATTMDELCKRGPLELDSMRDALALLGRAADDLAAAKLIAEARMHTGHIEHAVYRVQRGDFG